MRNGIIRTTAFFLAFLIPSAGAFASSCSATNEVGDTCSISCATGESAVCKQGSGSSAPECYCNQDNLYDPTKATDDIIQRYLDSPKALNASPGIRASSPQSMPKNFLSADISTESSRSKLIQDIPAIINGRLSQLRDYTIGEECRDVKVGRQCYSSPGICSPVSFSPLFPDVKIWKACIREHFCHDEMARQCSPTVGKLAFGGQISILGQPVATYTPPSRQEIPVSYLEVNDFVANCSPNKARYEFTHRETVSVGVSIKKTKIVKSGTSFSVKLGAELGALGAGGKYEVNISNTNEVTMSDGEDVDRRRSEDITRSLPVEQDPYTITTMKHTFIYRVVPIAYSGTVVFDATIQPNREGVISASSVLSEDQRTFEFSGVIENASVSDGQFVISGKKYAPEECDAKAAELAAR